MKDTAAKYLGPKLKPATFTVGKRKIAGFRAPTKLDPDAVVPLATAAAQDDLAVFHTTDAKHELFAIPGVAAADIVELVRVGTHNRDDSDWRKVKATVAQIEKRAPFVVVLADAAGLIGVFSKSLAMPAARAIADLLVAELPTALEVMEGEMGDLLDEADDEPPSYAQMLATYIQRKQRFHLWWD